MKLDLAITKAWDALPQAAETTPVRFLGDRFLVDVKKRKLISLTQERPPGDDVKLLVLHYLGRKIAGRPAATGKWLDGWGKADNHVHLPHDTLFLLEVETNQKHPNTNILKIWPYLEAQAKTTLVLAQVFNVGAKNESSSRARLAAWVAEKMTETLAGRFSYYRLLQGPDGKIEGALDELRTFIASLQKTTEAKA